MFDFIGKICLVVIIFAAGHYVGIDGVQDFFAGLSGK
jgi:hypothetical protein|tara:strand:- start:683 stop:793 length:111 start_codon:yes stop_codon:yes gene_type:complete